MDYRSRVMPVTARQRNQDIGPSCRDIYGTEDAGDHRVLSEDATFGEQVLPVVNQGFGGNVFLHKLSGFDQTMGDGRSDVIRSWMQPTKSSDSGNTPTKRVAHI